MAIMLQRMCWNSNSWRGPTGELYGKENSYVGKNGFGGEEWNFNTSDLIDGLIYGYTYYNPPEDKTVAKENHDIFFYSINPGKVRLLVGAYQNTNFLTAEEQKKLKQKFGKSDYFDRRIEELVALGLPNITSYSTAKKLLKGFGFLNVCVRPESIEIYNPPRELTKSDTDGRNPKLLTRYTRPVFLSRKPAGSVIDHPPTLGTKEDLITDVYLRYTHPQQKIIIRSHNILSNRFREWLESNGATNIRAESGRLDVVCNHNGFLYLFELKVCYRESTRHALREALGQLLEYAFYPGRTKHDLLSVVIDTVPAMDDIKWLRSIKRSGVEIELFWLKGKTVYAARITNSSLANKAK